MPPTTAAVVLALAGCGCLRLFVARDSAAGPARLLPERATDLDHPVGCGIAMTFVLPLSMMSFIVYGPILLISRGVSVTGSERARHRNGAAATRRRHHGHSSGHLTGLNCIPVIFIHLNNMNYLENKNGHETGHVHGLLRDLTVESGLGSTAALTGCSATASRSAEVPILSQPCLIDRALEHRLAAVERRQARTEGLLEGLRDAITAQAGEGALSTDES